MRARRLDRTAILDLAEISAVVGYLRARMRRRRGRRGPHVEHPRNLAVFRLATCAGLRASEIAGLRLGDVHTGIERPYIAVPGRICKRGYSRRVPLTWDFETAADLHDWKCRREAAGAGPDDPFIVRVRRGCNTGPLWRSEVRNFYRSACRCLGARRLATISTHTGRHTFASWALREHSLRAVQAALGHRSIGSTDRYAHLIGETEGSGRLFGPSSLATIPVAPPAGPDSGARGSIVPSV